MCIRDSYALDKIAPGTATDDTLLYGVEVKFYNMEVALDINLETPHKGLFVIGDGSGVTHSLSHASASGVYVARYLAIFWSPAPYRKGPDFQAPPHWRLARPTRCICSFSRN